MQSTTYQYQSAKPNHSLASEVSRGPCSGVAAVSVPLVNGCKGSFLPPAEPPPLRLSSMGSGDLGQVGQRPGPAEEASQLQGACSLPVKSRHYSSTAALGHSQPKGHHTTPPSPPLSVFGGPELSNSTTDACACQSEVVACVAFLTNDPVCAAVSCETLNIEQAERDVKGQCVGASLSSGSPPCYILDMLGVAEFCYNKQRSKMLDFINLMTAF